MQYLKNIYLLCALPFKWAFLLIYKAWYKNQLERKVIEAVRKSKLENRRYIVTMMFGRPRCYSKQQIKEAIKRRKFKKGVTIEQVEKHAYFITETGKAAPTKPEKIGSHKR